MPGAVFPDAVFPETHWPPEGSDFADVYLEALRTTDDAARCDRLGWSGASLRVFALDLEDVVSFDFSKIQNQY